MSDEIQQNRYDQLVRRVAGTIGPGSKVAQVITELFPMIDVENVPPELYVLMGTGLAFRSTDITAASGMENASQLANPVDSGKLITVTSLVVNLNVAAEIDITMNRALLASSNGFGQWRDNRIEGPGVSAAVGNTRIETGLLLLNTGIAIRMTANLTREIKDENGICVLAPGENLTVSTVSVARRLICGYFWRERSAEPSELSF